MDLGNVNNETSSSIENALTSLDLATSVTNNLVVNDVMAVVTFLEEVSAVTQENVEVTQAFRVA